jgi:hypothetical protein
MNLKLQSMLAYGIPASLEVIHLGFSDYLVPIQMDLAHFHDLLRTAHMDINLSQIVFSNKGAVGAALIARRGWSSRLAGMAIIPEVRGQKVGQWLMEQLVAQAIIRGDHRMELEVIEQNEPAVMPWQLSGENLAANGPPQRAYRLNSAFVSISDPDAQVVILRSLLTLPDARSQGKA